MERINEYNELNIISVNAKMALCLCVASRQAIHLKDEPRLYNIINNAIDASWEWIEVKSIQANDLYDNILKILDYIFEFDSDYSKKHAFYTCLQAVTYITWKADEYDYNKYGFDKNNLPEDMTEVTEDIVESCLNFALKANKHSLLEINLQKEAIKKAKLKYKSDDDEFGEIVSKDFF